MMKSLLVALGLAAATTAGAADFSDPTWPCVQRKVESLWLGQVWTGPEIPETAFTAWRDTPDIAALAGALAIRRTALETAETEIAAFSDVKAEEKEQALSTLFAGIFTLINRERKEIIAGIGRYAGKQTGLAEKIAVSQDELSALEAVDEDAKDWDRIEELQDQIAWDVRIFQDRQIALTHVCETPVILERRLFALGRAIMAQL